MLLGSYLAWTSDSTSPCDTSGHAPGPATLDLGRHRHHSHDWLESVLSVCVCRRIHGSVEDTKLSTNKQHSLSFRDRKLDGNYTRYQDAGGGCESSPSVATSCVFRAISAHIAPQFSQLREGLSTIKRSSLTIMGKKDEEERRRRRILPSGSHHRNATEIPH